MLLGVHCFLLPFGNRIREGFAYHIECYYGTGKVCLVHGIIRIRCRKKKEGMPSRRSMVFWKYTFSDSCICALDLCFFHAICRIWGSDILKSIMIYIYIFIANLGVPMIFIHADEHNDLYICLLIHGFTCTGSPGFHVPQHKTRQALRCKSTTLGFSCVLEVTPHVDAAHLLCTVSSFPR